MKKTMVMAGLVLLLAACGNDDRPKSEASGVSGAEGPERVSTVAVPEGGLSGPEDRAALTEEARAATRALGELLKEELEAVMKEGGPVEGMDICSVIAPDLTQMVSSENGMEVRRVSLKSRNAVLGAPNAWQIEVLRDFDARRAKGEDPASLVYVEVVDNQYRFMAAIPTSPVCLHCHGTAISPEVQARLKDLYPHDQAVGYREGDLRGAFVVTKELDR